MTDKIISFKVQCDIAYFNQGEDSLIPDDVYDAIFGESDTVGVAGYGIDTPHYSRMYSLQKHYDEDGQPPLDKAYCVESPKLDGAAISLLYGDGELLRALTRGDGIKGLDVTTNVQHLVPQYLNWDVEGLTQITGEVVANKAVPNSRNMASGALGIKDEEAFYSRIGALDLTFVAYGIQTSKGHGLTDTYIDDLVKLRLVGFNTVLDDTDKFPTDGTVFRLDSNARFNAAGYTAKHPRGAYAHKVKQKPVVTKLLDVVWQTGKSGKVTPVALLEPIVIGEATVTRATLNNMAYIEALGLEIGCNVAIIRSGEIIPQVVARVDLS